MSRTLNLPHFLFLNGPPGSGKSTLARMITESHPSAWRESFAEPIRDMIRAVFFPEWGPLDSPRDFRDQKVKDSKLAELANLNLPDEVFDIDPTLREAMIAFSETYMKPRFGSDIFGRLCFKRCVEQTQFYSSFIIDDLGFSDEAKFIIARVGADNCHLVRLHRVGCSFSNDSRSYLSLPGVQTLDLNNNGHPTEMMDMLGVELGYTTPTATAPALRGL